MLNSFQLSILSFLFGVGFHSIYYNLEFNISVFHYIAFVSGIFIVIFYVYSRINSLLAKVFIFVLFFALGVLRFHASLPEYQDIRDDRVYSYFDIRKNVTQVYRVQLNAAYPGRYYLPTVACSAMYDDGIFARVPGQWVEVTNREVN